MEAYIDFDVIVCIFIWNTECWSNQFSRDYRQFKNIGRTKSRNSTDSCLVLQLSFSNLLKPGVESRMKIQLEQRLNGQQFYCLLRYLIRGLTVKCIILIRLRVFICHLKNNNFPQITIVYDHPTIAPHWNTVSAKGSLPFFSQNELAYHRKHLLF